MMTEAIITKKAVMLKPKKSASFRMILKNQ